MGRIVSDDIIDGDQNGRVAGEFKDGTQTRRIELLQGNVIVFKSVEGQELYREQPLPSDFAARTVSADHSSFTGHVVLVIGGFTVNSGNARVLTIATDYKIAPAIEYGAPNNTVDDIP